MVVAGPGTGKTELLSVRAAHILQKTDTLPENILCLTFTESGQAAMRQRLVDIIGKDAYRVAIHTFHSFGSELMSHNREYFYQSALFEPADDLKQYEVLRGIFEELEFSNPLSSMMNGEYTHLSDAQKVISELKRSSALTSDELRAVIEQSEATLDALERILSPILDIRISARTAPALQDALEHVRAHAATVTPLYEVTPLAHIILESLEATLEDTISVHPTAPITAWKGNWFERDSQKKLVFKNRKRLEKLKALTHIYYEYLSRMEKLNLFDYDDMVMQVVHAMETHDDLKFNLQEKYLYIMVDEFQDTNLAQLRILHALTDNPVNEGAPNILVVGDDDQAVYGFQGADISNILNFSEKYPTRALVVLTENYRSGASILETSRAVITQGADRLESRIPELNKQLNARGPAASQVDLWSAPTIEGERYEIVRSIAQLIAEGAAPSSIAVLGRRHSDLQALLPFFAHADIPVRYQHVESVLDTEPVIALERLGRVLVALGEGKHDHVQAFLPELLAHPAWQLDPQDIWRLSLDSHTKHETWMELMARSQKFLPIHHWLIEMAHASINIGLEPMIDAMIGRPDPEAHGSEATSPFFTYFFGPKVLARDPEHYIAHLNALRAIRTRLREHQPGANLTLKSFIEFIELHRRLNIGITLSHDSQAQSAPAVQLMTAHASKGLEFDTVFVVNSVDSVWGQRARTVSRSISYPENLPLAPTGNTADERLRLFYVAMTRAKQHLIISYAARNDTDKETLLADFLLAVTTPTRTIAEAQTPAERVETAQLAWYEPLTTPTSELNTLLETQLEQFKLSTTALNHFLDVTRGGPQQFLLNDLLHFPSMKSAPARYGTAVHATMRQAHLHVQVTGEEKPLEDSLRDFELALTKARLEPDDLQRYLQQGSVHIPIFLNSRILPLSRSQKSEVNFNYQDVRCGEARITGSLDVMDVNPTDKTILVTDYKTGHPASSWKGSDERGKQKLHSYRQQLIFYKILVEQSAEYHTYTVNQGQLAFIEPTRAGESILLPLDITPEDVTRTKALIEAVWKHIMALDLPDTSHYSPDLKGVLAFEQDLIDGLV